MTRTVAVATANPRTNPAITKPSRCSMRTLRDVTACADPMG
jgi:hypothetical protein